MTHTGSYQDMSEIDYWQAVETIQNRIRNWEPSTGVYSYYDEKVKSLCVDTIGEVKAKDNTHLNSHLFD